MTIKVSDKALKSLEEKKTREEELRENEYQYVKCINSSICPTCGSDMSTGPVYRYKLGFMNSLTCRNKICLNCGFVERQTYGVDASDVGWWSVPNKERRLNV